MARTLTRRRLARRTTLMERLDRVDRESGVLRGVKVLGLESRNGRRYTPECLREAAPLYEGASVRLNHPRKATATRHVEEGLGWLESVEVREDGLYADLHYYRSHPFAEQLIEAAERNPRGLGLSHNADGDTRREGKTEVVYRICEVRSVDLVLDPATTTGLFESRTGKRMKLKSYLESLVLAPKARAAAKRLLEAAGDMDMGEEMAAPPPADAPAADHTAALRQGFEGALMQVVQEALDGGDAKEALKRIKEMLAAHAKLIGGAAAPSPSAGDEPVPEGEDEELQECDDEEDEPMREGRDLRRRLRELEGRERSRELCEEVGFRPGKRQIEVLALLRDDRARRELIEEMRGERVSGRPRTRAVVEGRDRPARSTPASITEIKSGKDLAAALLGE